MRRTLVSIDPSELETGRGAPYRFRWRLPGDDRQSDADAELIASAARHGIIDPPTLHGAYRIVVCGHRRIAAARAAGIGRIDAFLVGDDAAAKEEIALLWLEDARHGAPLSDLERIMLATKCSTILGEPSGESRDALELAAGKALSDEYLDDTAALLELPEDIRDSLHDGAITTGDLLSLGAIDRLRAARILARSGLGRKERREAIRMMLRLGDGGSPSWERFAEAYEKKGGPLLERLRAEAYPSLDGDLGRIGQLIESIGMPHGAAIHHPENLEGGSYRLDARIRDEQTFGLLLEKLQRALGEGTIGRLLDMLKGRAGRGGKK